MSSNKQDLKNSRRTIKELLKSKSPKRLVGSLVLFALAAFAFLMVIYWANQDKPTYTITESTGTEYETAKVLSVVEDNTVIDEETEGVKKGSMDIKIQLLSGRYKGDICYITNYFSALYNVDVTEGDTVSVRIDTTDVGVYSVSVYNYNRVPLIIGLVLLFFLALAVIGGKQGMKAFLGLVYTVICIVFILLPLTLKGFSPVAVTCVLIFLTSLVCFFLIGGVQVKTVSAAIGSLCGTLIAALLGHVAAQIGGVTTFQMEEAEALLLVKSTFELNMSGLLTSGILIAALGAVMDISMSIASALDELYALDGTLGVKALFASGMNIGRDAMGTMANTLVLAYVGSSLNMMILIYWYGVSFNQLMNTDFVAIEMIRAVAGSIGIICTVPCVAIITAFALVHAKKSL